MCLWQTPPSENGVQYVKTRSRKCRSLVETILKHVPLLATIQRSCVGGINWSLLLVCYNTNLMHANSITTSPFQGKVEVPAALLSSAVP